MRRPYGGRPTWDVISARVNDLSFLHSTRPLQTRGGPYMAPKGSDVAASVDTIGIEATAPDTKTPGRETRPGESDDQRPQCEEARTDAPFGIRVASTMSWVSLSGGAVIRLTTTMATRLTGMPMIPNRRWSMPIHGSMPAKRTM